MLSDGTPPPLPCEAQRRPIAGRVALCLVGVIVLIAVAVYYYRHDPGRGGLPCTFKLLTGYDCPGCGSQRALHALLHGRVAEALHFNPLVFIAAPAAVMYIVVEACRDRLPRMHAAITHYYVTTAILIIVVSCWILRNIL